MKKRQIKFRAYDTFTKKMWKWEEHNAFSDQKGSIKQWFEDSDLIQMEFTGCYDINGKEIYEGDIVKEEGISEMWVVVFFQGCFGDFEEESGTFTSFSEMDGRVEVVGNICQHKKLLEKVDGKK